ncbi:MAG: ABC transporter substrate-binding protein [Candidatus Saccharimonadales bacterium]
MVNRLTKLRLRRVFRRRRKQVVQIGENTEQQLEKHLIKRLIRLPNIQRFLIGWIGLLLVVSIGLVLQTRALGGKYQTLQPKPGGTYTEGIIGTFTNANPLYASSAVDSSVSRLVFSGLLKQDKDNKLIGDLAESWSIDEKELVYTVKLKPNLQWHDGKPLTSKDVIFTYQQIQNPETKSYLLSSWKGIKFEAPDLNTVVFKLPNSLSSFPYSLTNGIVPEHILASVEPSQLRSTSFNNVDPVGSGPFRFSKVEVASEATDKRQERIALSAFDNYHEGRPKIDTFIIRTFASEPNLITEFADHKINAMVGLSALPDQFRDDTSVLEFGVPLNGEVMVFFKTTQEVLKDPAVRKALVLSTNKKDILDQLPYPLLSIDGPLLKSHIGYDKSYAQVTGKPEEAKKNLDAAGWVVDPATGIRAKAGVKLSFKLSSRMSSEYSSVAGSLQKQWRDIGVDMQVELQNDKDLQSTLALHNYDALLYGISVGSDPDVFPYWHGSQADASSATVFNFSEYNSVVANQALEGGRTRSDAQLRSIKYKPFLEAWRNDAPALALYQPRFLYVARAPLYGLENNTSVNDATDRFTHVERWTIRQGLQSSVAK